MSADVEGPDSVGRKRSHGSFLKQDSEHIKIDLSLSDKENNLPFISTSAAASPAAESSPGLTEAGSSPSDRNSPSPNAAPACPPTQFAGTAAPLSISALQQSGSVMAKPLAQAASGEPPKKKRVTAEDKDAKTAKAAMAAMAEAEKRQKAEERERKRREKEEAERLKAASKAAKAAEKAEKEQEKKQRAEEKERKKREKEEQEAKKARSQMKLTNMFKTESTTAKKEQRNLKTANQAEAAPSSTAADGGAKEPSLYEQMFKPFFVKQHIRLASNPFELKEETREAKTRLLEEYLQGKREHQTLRFDPLEVLQTSYKRRRGRVYPSVRKIMAEFHGLSSNAAGDLTAEAQAARIRRTLEALRSVPVKSIKFREDVRPPYIGTISGLPPGIKSLQQLARNPVSRKITSLNYDYDSEAEWQDEEGEDVDELDDEEEEGDNDEDMADFLDDSEDVGPSRMVFSGGMEPESSGLCWENRKRFNSQPKMLKYRLEFVLESLEQHHDIDPFSTAYWETPKSKSGPGNGTSTAPASTSTSASVSVSACATKASLPTASNSVQDSSANPMAPPPPPSDAVKVINQATGGSKKAQQPLPPDMQEKLKALVLSMPKLSKLGVIELFAAENPGCSRPQIKSSFEALFEKSGKVFKLKGA
ncbi:hypothetical protein VTK56DRAFT_9454 [Thermocarpiscus australiensis]